MLSHEETHRFSALVKAFLGNDTVLDAFRGLPTNAAGMAAAVAQRRAFPTDRQTLVGVLQEQYADLEIPEPVAENIAALQNKNTFTVCTAHQPALLTGAGYFVYKILHTVKLAQHFAGAFPDCRFVPVFYIGSEDNDLEELGTFSYEGERYRWPAEGQGGAVGRMKTDSLSSVFDALFKKLGPPGLHLDSLKEMITQAYQKGETIASATRRLVNSLLGAYGVVVIDGDHPRLKAQLLPAMQADLFEQKPYELAKTQSDKLEAHFPAQAFPRPVNLFYLTEGIRERIERRSDDEWTVLNTAVSWNRKALEEELALHPERFSPNVVLRGLYQEIILPDVAFIGGGAEVAYWMQLQTLFHYFKVPFPLIVLRQSAQWASAAQVAKMQQIGLSPAELFLPAAQLMARRIAESGENRWSLEGEKADLEKLMQQVEARAAALDPTLKTATAAEGHRFQKRMTALEKKLYRAEKRRHGEWAARLEKLQTQLFPGGGLQERSQTFMEGYLKWGSAFFDAVLENTLPFGEQFLWLEESV
jgi:bacillithiol biosynthesis cysteine-adding enzyme BshC